VDRRRARLPRLKRQAEQRPQPAHAAGQFEAGEAGGERGRDEQRSFDGRCQRERLQPVRKHHDHRLVEDVEREHRRGEVAARGAVAGRPLAGEAQHGGECRPLVHRVDDPLHRAQRIARCGVQVRREIPRDEGIARRRQAERQPPPRAQRFPHRVMAREQEAEQEHAAVERVVVTVVDERMGRREAAHQQHAPQHQQQRGPQQHADAAEGACEPDAGTIQ